jgi:hypothetical protein
MIRLKTAVVSLMIFLLLLLPHLTTLAGDATSGSG